MALTTIILVVLLAFTIWQLRAQSKSQDIAIEDWWEISSYLNSNYGKGEMGTKRTGVRLLKDNDKKEKRR